MTVVTRASHFSTDGITAQEARRQLYRSTAGAKGVNGVNDLEVTAGTGLQVSVADGSAIIPGTLETYQGSYFAENQGAELVTIATADPTNPRWDLIVLKVEDSSVSGATDAASIVAVTGTAAGSPAEPALPENAIRLARVVVNASATAPSSIVDQRFTDGQRVVPSVAARSGLVASGTFNSALTTTSAATTTVLTVSVPVVDGVSYEFNLNTGVWYASNAAGPERLEWATTQTGTFIRDYITDVQRRMWFGKALYTATSTTTLSVAVQCEVNGFGMIKDTAEAAMQFWVREIV